MKKALCFLGIFFILVIVVKTNSFALGLGFDSEHSGSVVGIYNENESVKEISINEIVTNGSAISSDSYYSKGLIDTGGTADLHEMKGNIKHTDDTMEAQSWTVYSGFYDHIYFQRSGEKTTDISLDFTVDATISDTSLGGESASLSMSAFVWDDEFTENYAWRDADDWLYESFEDEGEEGNGTSSNLATLSFRDVENFSQV